MSGRRGRAGGIHSQISSMAEWLSNGFKQKKPTQTHTTTQTTSLLAPCSAEQHVRSHHQDRVLASKCHQVQKDGISGPLKHHPDHPALVLLLFLSCPTPFLTGTCDIYLQHSNGSSVPVTSSALMAGIQVRNLPTQQREDFGHSSISSFHNLL